MEAVSPTLVTAAMSGGSDAYEEFVVRPLHGGGSEATLTLWVTLPDGLSDEVVAAAAAGSLASISKELRLMKQVLEGGAPDCSPGCAPSGCSASASARRARPAGPTSSG